MFYNIFFNFQPFMNFYLTNYYFSQILGHRSMWNTTNYLLVNLSIADLMMTLLNTLFNFILMRDKYVIIL